MRRGGARRLRALGALALASCLGVCAAYADGPFSVERLQERPRAVLAGTLRAAVSEDGMRFVSPDGEVARIWLRKAPLPLPPKSAPPEKNVFFGALPPGALVGLVEWRRAWSDFRGQMVPPGLYTLRYAVQPILKDHAGVSRTRDFLLLSAADSDRGGLDAMDPAALIPQSRSVAGRHPAVLALVPAPAAGPQPAIARDESGATLLVVALQGVRLGLVLVGRGGSGDF